MPYSCGQIHFVVAIIDVVASQLSSRISVHQSDSICVANHVCCDVLLQLLLYSDKEANT